VELVLELYKNLLPVISFILIGYFIKSKIKFNQKFISFPLIYFLLPVLVIYNISEASMEKIIILPAITFLLALGMNLPALLSYHTFAGKENIYLLKSSFTFFNVAFFGIPTITALFGKAEISSLICAYLGTALYGNTVGYYQVAKTKFTSKEAIIELLKIPYLYVFIFALIFKALAIDIPDEAEPVMNIVGWIVSAAGMLIVGLNLIDIDLRKLNFNYFSGLLGVRIIGAVLILALIAGAEYLFLEKLEMTDYLILALIPFFPIASNVSLFATFLNTEEERFSLFVLLSIIVSLVLVPIVAQFFPEY
jgi:malate permease and related proteins